mgnify:CR=1 FL=1
MKTLDNAADNAVPTSLEERITAAVTEAHSISDRYGTASREAAVAWDIVEELHAEAAHQRVAHGHETAFSAYCDAYPDAAEARIYDV